MVKLCCTRSGAMGSWCLLSVVATNLRLHRAHEPTYPFPADAVTTCDQFLPHFWPAVLRLDLCMDDTDVGQQSFVAHVLEGARLAQLSKPLRRPCSK